MTARNPQELAAFLESLEDYVPTVLKTPAIQILQYVPTLSLLWLLLVRVQHNRYHKR